MQGDNLTPSDDALPRRARDRRLRAAQFSEIVFPVDLGNAPLHVELRHHRRPRPVPGPRPRRRRPGLEPARDRPEPRRPDGRRRLERRPAEPCSTTSPTSQNVGSVYDALSPEAYDAQTTVSVEAGRRIAALLFGRPRDCQAGDVDPWDPNHRVLPCHARRVSPWAATLGSFRSRDGFDGHNRYDAQLGGLIAGVDVQPLAGLDLTFAVSSQRGSIDVASAGESTLTARRADRRRGLEPRRPARPGRRDLGPRLPPGSPPDPASMTRPHPSRPPAASRTTRAIARCSPPRSAIACPPARSASSRWSASIGPG